MDERNCSTHFFGFGAEDTKETLTQRLQAVKTIGIGQIIASYKTAGMTPAQFDAVYFKALDMLVDACRRENVRFWLEDYAPFPTGSANGAYKEEANAHLNKLFVDERHMDVTGPIENALIRIDLLQNVVYGKAMHRFAKVDVSGRKRLAVVAYRLDEHSDPASSVLCEETAVRLDDKISDGFLKWDVPEGHWRVFVVYTTYESTGRANFMNLLSKDSVALEIEKVHQPLYEHLKDELGKTWIGFFYDEPEIGNAGDASVFDFFMLPGRRSQAPTDCNVYPWSPEMAAEMGRRDEKWMEHLPYLWYDGVCSKDEFTTACGDFRCRYMDAVSSLVRENYNGQVYAFCKQRGIAYIGHVLEDENCHTRLGCGPGHYFRQQYYQDEAGIDVIAGQILPGRDYAASWYGVTNADGEFYHYGLAKLASSEAHINPLKKNRAAAECFAMYGQQGLSGRKFLLDHLMVNGVNRMLLAELPSYQASEQYSRLLVNYTDTLCALLRTARPVIKTAILYHAESEWREGGTAQKFQKPAAQLARNQISYDVIPADVFTYPQRYHTETAHGLSINGHAYEALVIPACDVLPEAVADFVRQCMHHNFPVFFTDRLPMQFTDMPESQTVKCVPLSSLAAAVAEAISCDLTVAAVQKSWLRYAHVIHNDADYYFIHNEAPQGGMDCEVTVAADGKVLMWDVMSDMYITPKQTAPANGRVRVTMHFAPYEMKVLCTANAQSFVPGQACVHKGGWRLELPDGRSIRSENLPKAEDYVEHDFYGKLIYKTTFTGETMLPKLLELPEVCDCCEVLINGISAGKRPAAPYIYDVSEKLHEGVNDVTIEVYTSAENVQNPAAVFGIPMNALTALPYSLVEPMGIGKEMMWRF